MLYFHAFYRCSYKCHKTDQWATTLHYVPSKTSENIHIKIQMPNPSQDPPAPNQDLKDMDVLCSFKIKKNFGASKTSDHIQIKMKMQNPIQ